MPDQVCGYNLAAEFLNVYAQVQNNAHQERGDKAHELDRTYKLMRTISILKNHTDEAKREGKASVDFSKNAPFCAALEELRHLDSERADQLCGHGGLVWKKADLESFHHKLETEIKTLTNDASRIASEIQMVTEESLQMAKTGSDVVGENRSAMQNMARRMTGRG